ncbi:MAG TPA: RNA-binding cell elongation regulator Jag/EloR [Armatimonadota bacterium]|jgi:spoIIIJ-associated protein
MTDQPAQPLFDDSPAAVACEVSQEMLDAAGLSATAAIQSEDADSVEIALEGEDAALLIGKQGQTLNAFQYIVGLIVARRLDRRFRVTVDAEQYRVRRAETLVKMAKDLAAQVREHNQEAVMDPLNAAERRIVHTALAEEPGISTYSEGEDPDRRVVISPKA